ncbi:MAG: ADP-glyceromanno-heptose 6-epimerase [Vulcanimicrobiota bacterium]
MNRRFIVTGGAGFIGSNLVKALNDRGYYDITVVDHIDRIEKSHNLRDLRYGQYLDKADFRAILKADRLSGVDGVFHLGACSSTTEPDEAYLLDNNYQYSRELCEWSMRTGTRFIYASSAATYGDGSKGYSDEDAVTPTLEPMNAYGYSKQTFDLWALRTGALHHIAGLKYFNVYGPYEDHKGDMRSLVNKSYGQVQNSGKIALFKSYRSDYRDGEQLRDFIHVTDAVSVTLFFLDHPEISGLFNCGTGTARTWINLANALFDAMERPRNITFIDMPENIREKYQYHTCSDVTKLRRAGYTEQFTSIEEGVHRYVKDYLLRRTEDGRD